MTTANDTQNTSDTQNTQDAPIYFSRSVVPETQEETQETQETFVLGKALVEAFKTRDAIDMVTREKLPPHKTTKDLIRFFVRGDDRQCVDLVDLEKTFKGSHNAKGKPLAYTLPRLIGPLPKNKDHEGDVLGENPSDRYRKRILALATIEQMLFDVSTTDHVYGGTGIQSPGKSGQFKQRASSLDGLNIDLDRINPVLNDLRAIIASGIVAKTMSRNDDRNEAKSEIKSKGKSSRSSGSSRSPKSTVEAYAPCTGSGPHKLVEICDAQKAHLKTLGFDIDQPVDVAPTSAFEIYEITQGKSKDSVAGSKLTPVS